MALREILARFAFKVDGAGLRKANTGIGSVIGKMQAFGAVTAGSAVVRGVKDFVTNMVDAGDALGKTATQLGLSSDELQGWQAAAGFAGVETTKFNQSLRILAKNALTASTDGGRLEEKFKGLGIEVNNASGGLKSSNELMRETGLALGKLENRTEAVALAQELMGRTGAQLLPLFAKGEAGLEASLGALQRFGGGLSKELIPLAEDAQDRFAEWDIAMLSLKSRIAVAILPALNSLVLSLSKMAAAVSKFLGKGHALQSLLVAVGLVIGKLAIAKFGSQLLSLGRAAILPIVKFALLLLLVDELITLFKGGDTIIGRFIDKLFGAGTTEQFVKGIKDVIDALGKGDFEGALEAAGNGLSTLGGKILEATEKVPGLSTALFGVIGGLPEQAKAFEHFGKRVADYIKATVTAVKALAPKFLEAAGELATALIDGMVEGIKEGIKAVTDAVVDMAKGAVDAAKKIFKPGSGSRVFNQLGRQNIQGLVEGMQMAADRAAKTAGNISANVVVAGSEGAAEGLNRGGGVATAVGRRGALGGRGGGPMAIFNSDIRLTVTGGSANDPQIQKLRQGVRSELRDNRRATLAALEQLTEPV
jgi:hypothetical protein